MKYLLPILLFVLALQAHPAPQDKFSSKQVPLYRLYNPNIAKHHYTADLHEYTVLGDLGWNQEGISCMVRSSNTNNSTVYHFPEGTHDFTGDVTFQRGISLQGAGVDRTILRFHGTGSGIKIFPAVGNGNTSIRDLTIHHVTDGQADTPAITVDFYKQIDPASGFVMSRVTPRITIKDVHITGQWLNGIVLVDPNHSTIQNVHITGHLVNGVNQTNHGIVFMGNAAGTEIQVKDSWVYHTNIGIEVRDAVEGIICDGLTLVAVHGGIRWHSNSRKPHLSLTNSHINARDFAVQTIKVHQTIIRGNLFYKDRFNANYIGISHYDSNDHVIIGNIFKDLQGGGTNTSVKIDHCGGYIISNNIMKSPVAITNKRDTNVVANNLIRN